MDEEERKTVEYDTQVHFIILNPIDGIAKIE